MLIQRLEKVENFWCRQLSSGSLVLCPFIAVLCVYRHERRFEVVYPSDVSMKAWFFGS